VPAPGGLRAPTLMPVQQCYSMGHSSKLGAEGRCRGSIYCMLRGAESSSSGFHETRITCPFKVVKDGPCEVAPDVDSILADRLHSFRQILLGRAAMQLLDNPSTTHNTLHSTARASAWSTAVLQALAHYEDSLLLTALNFCIGYQQRNTYVE
jgi:hypothetical protein